ncbi:BadF/BadG/BcrA/BcrD ATPase family protein [Microbacterium sp. LWS13-1.2]|uniref:ATPase BadF/BadG/BcrA/BcrD type domain-containing protein n=1 Tax=Microbacterium sp. LWS13-1.2 TaxID=3135264 RepID=A0AAU6SE78_9MICO
MTTTDDGDYALAIDAGQTGIRVRVRRAGALSAEHVMPGVRTHEPLLPQLAAVVKALTDTPGARVEVISAGVSGLTADDSDAAALTALLGDLHVDRVFLAHDSVTSYLGALGTDRGAVVAAGTGVVTLAVGDRHVARVDGWGNIMGDAGSGYWIGRQGLEAAMRAHDGRGERTQLLHRLRDRWADPETAYIRLQSDPLRVSAVASFAKDVTELASTDAVAARICKRAARELAASVVASLARVEGESASSVSTVGGIFRSQLILGQFEHRLTKSLPTVRFVSPQGDGLDGAERFQTLPPLHPLWASSSISQHGAL